LREQILFQSTFGVFIMAKDKEADAREDEKAHNARLSNLPNREKRRRQEAVQDIDDTPPEHLMDFEGGAERGLDVAEARLAADPENQLLKNDVETKRRNLEKAKAMKRV
jgi:hypothetical protein